MEMHQYSSSSSGGGSPKIDWALLSHLELDSHKVYDTSTANDLWRLVASSNVVTARHERASISIADLCRRTQMKESANQQRNSHVVDPPGVLTNATTMSSLSIFGHSLSAYAGRASVDTVSHEQMKIIEPLSAITENKLLHSDPKAIQQAGKRKHSIQGPRRRQECMEVEQLLTCIDDESCLQPGVFQPTKNMHVQNLLGKHLSGLAVSGNSTPDASTLSRNEGHIMAERRRREKLNQRFIALSAILPGLKKVDQASMLDDTIKYVKQLEQQLHKLEETSKAAKCVVAKSVKAGCPTNTSSGNVDRHRRQQQPDIEARGFGNHVLIHVHCDKIKNLLVKCVEELERLPLSIVNANVLSFSDTAYELSFTAQIDEGCDHTAEEIVEALHAFYNRLKY